jgi:hypothetical protein
LRIQHFSGLLEQTLTKALVGANGRLKEVAATIRDANPTKQKAKRAAARTAPPQDEAGKNFEISDAHLKFQKGFIKENGQIGKPAADRLGLLDYLDAIRDRLVAATKAHHANPAKNPLRLTLGGLVARLLSFDRYRKSGFTESLFRQALFTALMEAHVAPTRLSKESIDMPLEVSVNTANKYAWPARFWNFLSVFAGYLDNATIDDVEVEAFEEHAVLLLTFHQTALSLIF